LFSQHAFGANAPMPVAQSASRSRAAARMRAASVPVFNGIVMTHVSAHLSLPDCARKVSPPSGGLARYRNVRDCHGTTPDTAAAAR
jgi:hypothetical protein